MVQIMIAVVVTLAIAVPITAYVSASQCRKKIELTIDVYKRQSRRCSAVRPRYGICRAFRYPLTALAEGRIS